MGTYFAPSEPYIGPVTYLALGLIFDLVVKIIGYDSYQLI